ncbi:hydrogenase expression/formation protein HypE [Hyphococcus luteus]|uniref:Hydrogenase expression/formation protein HypE n=1 Tax=Hyphococcus luteus TaxID=2058213 RepID=A0A2S7K0I0_9PROT|nr:hydrogenase expression/formation protein HypE [Marinicaulis flavus]PQA85976.1 hydrogenase expression/formation protein HypE [Marinicaulis flavus]
MKDEPAGPHCAINAGDGALIQLGHGGGGSLMRDLIGKIIAPAMDQASLDIESDGAAVSLGGPAAFTTDSYVVSPLFFPGGDIGSLAVNGTVNDLAMCAAEPSYLSVSFIIEEGLSIETLKRVAQSIGAAAKTAGARIATGDTKVVERGKGDGLYINTAGVGSVKAPFAPGPSRLRPGDAIILSGDIGRHGVAVMASRAELDFTPPIRSDCAPLWDQVRALIDAGVELHCLRDLTRGGLAAALVEIAQSAGCEIAVDEPEIAVSEQISSACELLGLDPIHVANEGRFIAVVPAEHADLAVATLGSASAGQARRIGETTPAHQGGRALIRSAYGVKRQIRTPKGEQLPRIC